MKDIPCGTSVFAASTSAIRKKKQKNVPAEKKYRKNLICRYQVSSRRYHPIMRYIARHTTATFGIPFEYLPYSGYCQPSGDFSPIVPNSPFPKFASFIKIATL